MKVPKKQMSNVALCGWKVHAIEACWVGSVMHFWKVLMLVTVVQWAEMAVSKCKNTRKKRGRIKERIMVVMVGTLKLNEESYLYRMVYLMIHPWFVCGK